MAQLQEPNYEGWYPTGYFLPDIQALKLAVSQITTHARRSDPASLTPVIIIPSLVGSVLTATLKDFNSGYFYCPKTWNDPFYIWLDNTDGFLFYVNCWFEHMTLQFDPHTNVSSSAPGIPPNFPKSPSTSCSFRFSSKPSAFFSLFFSLAFSVLSRKWKTPNWFVPPNRSECRYQGLRRSARGWLHGSRPNYRIVEWYYCRPDLSWLWNW